MTPRELIETTDGVGHHVLHEKTRKSTERESVGTCSQPLLDCAYGAFHFADVTVGGDHIHGDGEQVGAKAFEFVVAMYVADRETSGLVELDGFSEPRENG